MNYGIQIMYISKVLLPFCQNTEKKRTQVLLTKCTQTIKSKSTRLHKNVHSD